MFKKTVTFEDFDGNSHTKDFYFHLSKSELLAMSANGNAMQERIRRIIESNDGAKILYEFREMIKLACGVRSQDGLRFMKDPESQSALLDSPAFDELLMELATDAKASAAFVEQLIPKKMQEEMIEQLKKSGQTVPAQEDNRPLYERENRHPTHEELLLMPKDEMIKAIVWAKKNNL